MRKTLFCLTVLVPLGCSEYSPTVDGAGGTRSTAPSSSATGGSSVGTEGTSVSGGTSGSTTANGEAGTAVSSVGGGGSSSTSAGSSGMDSGGTNAAGGPATAGGDASIGGSNAAGGSIPTAGTASTNVSGCGLPYAGSTGVLKPSGAVGGFKVIDWAGFTGAVSFAFDDGTTSTLEHYTRLKDLGVHYTFFLIGSSATLNKAKWQQAVADGNELGNHTQFHKQGDPAGSNVAAGQQTIESNYNVKTYTMAAPFGNDYTTIAPNYHFLSRGVANGVMKPNNDANAFETPAYLPHLGAKTDVLDAQVKLARDGKGWKVFVVHGFAGGDDYAYNPVDIDQFTATVQNAKNSGDMWIDTFANVGAYWRGQAAVSKVQATTSGSDQTWTWALPEHFPPGKCLRVTVTGGTLVQNGTALPWDDHGYYELSLDAGSVTLSP